MPAVEVILGGKVVAADRDGITVRYEPDYRVLNAVYAETRHFTWAAVEALI